MSSSPGAQGPFLVAEGVTRRFGERDVLRGVDLSVDLGEVVAIVGESGAGKSTLLAILGGLDRGYGGRVSIGGTRLSSLSEAALARFRNRNVGFVFQGCHLREDLTVRENVELPALLGPAHVGARELARCADQALARVGLPDRGRERPGALSGGQKQRVAVARALLLAPPLVVADEPTGNLDETSGRSLLDLLISLTAQGAASLVVVTHDSGVAARAARVVRLAQGRLASNSAGDPASRAQDAGAPG